MAYLAKLEDINKYLDVFKIEVTDADEAPFQLSAERVIKGTLAGILSITDLAAWSSPETTPGIISEIAGKYIAAMFYRKVYAEDMPDLAPYAQTLYAESMAWLELVRTGRIQLIDVSEDIVISPESSLDRTMFYPNDDAPPPLFTMDMTF